RSPLSLHDALPIWPPLELRAVRRLRPHGLRPFRAEVLTTGPEALEAPPDPGGACHVAAAGAPVAPRSRRHRRGPHHWRGAGVGHGPLMERNAGWGSPGAAGARICYHI